MLHRWMLILMVSVSMAAMAAGDRVGLYDFDNEPTNYDERLGTSWVELDTQVKSLPKEEDLTELPLDLLPKNIRMYGDLENIDINDQDYVTRLWLVARSKHGAYNGSYEGFRCATEQYKGYAHASLVRSQPLRVVEFPRWRPARQGSYRMELMKTILCDDTRQHPLNIVIDNLDRHANSYEPPS